MASRRRRPCRRRSGAAALACSLSLSIALGPVWGCAYFKGPEPVPPAFSKVALQTVVETTQTGELEGDLHGDTTVKGAAIGLGTGAVAGGGAGFWIGTASCAPTALFYGICLAVVTAAGAIVGGTGGMIVGGTTGLPWSAAGEVNDSLARLQREHDFEREFAAAVMEAIPEEKQVAPDVAAGPAGIATGAPAGAEAVVTASLEDVDLRQHVGQRMSIRLHASMTQQWGDASEPKVRRCEYFYTSPVHEVADWLLRDGEAFDDVFTEGMASISRWMARDLQAFSTRTALPETDSEPATCYQLDS